MGGLNFKYRPILSGQFKFWNTVGRVFDVARAVVVDIFRQQGRNTWSNGAQSPESETSNKCTVIRYNLRVTLHVTTSNIYSPVIMYNLQV